MSSSIPPTLPPLCLDQNTPEHSRPSTDTQTPLPAQDPPSPIASTSSTVSSTAKSTTKDLVSAYPAVDIEEGIMAEPDVKLEDIGGLVTTASNDEAERKRPEDDDPFGNEEGHEVKFKTMGWM